MSPGLRVGPGHFGEMTALCGCNRWLAKAAPVLYRTYTPYPSLLQRCLAVPSVEKWSLSLPAAPSRPASPLQAEAQAPGFSRRRPIRVPGSILAGGGSWFSGRWLWKGGSGEGPRGSRSLLPNLDRHGHTVSGQKCLFCLFVFYKFRFIF